MIIVVTGANRGLGYELVKAGVSQGDTMIASYLASQDTSDLEALQKQHPQQVVLLEMDVTSEESVQKAAQTVKEKFPAIDCVINNAGVLFESNNDKGDPIVNLDLNMLRRTVEVNTYGPAIVLKYFMPLIYAAKGTPCVINVTSEAGHLKTGFYGYLSYGVSKHAANMYTQKIVNYLRATPEYQHIRIFMLHPGRMNTVMGQENKQIEPDESALGILDIAKGKIDPKLDIPFINYKGEPMPY